MGIRRRVAKCLLRDDRGAVMMEYVIIGVLIAAACVIAVVTLSRAVFFGFDTARMGASGDSKSASGSRESYRSQVKGIQQSAEEYHDAMHTGSAENTGSAGNPK